MGKPPPASVLAWVSRQVGGEVTVGRGLREGGSPWLVRLTVGGCTSTAVLKVAASEVRQGALTEVTALTVAAAHGLPVPRVLAADPDGAVAGTPVVLQSVVAGCSGVARVVSGERLRAAGAVLAAVHAVCPDPHHGLPSRTRPISGSDFAAGRRCGDPSTPLLDLAADEVDRLRPPPTPSVLLHGDIWHGNLLWTSDRVTGIVDWDMAGVGHAGVDVGALRLDAALLYGTEAAAEVWAGWEAVRGRPATAFDPYWDVVAASNTPTDMAHFLRAIHDQGRTDLDAATLTGRRDDFLQKALARPQGGASDW